MKRNFYFTAKAGAGKTYACNYIKEKYGYRQAKFAYPIYAMARDYFDMKNKDRTLLQVLGTDIGRDLISDDIWINRFKEDLQIVEKTYKKLYGKEVGFVSDDCRFKNEHEMLKSMGWVGVYLDVSDEIRIERLKKRDGDAQANTLTHKSETGIDEFKDELIKIDSSGTLPETYAQLDKLINELCNGKTTDETTD